MDMFSISPELDSIQKDGPGLQILRQLNTAVGLLLGPAATPDMQSAWPAAVQACAGKGDFIAYPLNA